MSLGRPTIIHKTSFRSERVQQAAERASDDDDEVVAQVPVSRLWVILIYVSRTESAITRGRRVTSQGTARKRPNRAGTRRIAL